MAETEQRQGELDGGEVKKARGAFYAPEKVTNGSRVAYL